ncbi:hypothetical protein AAG906_015591 [Vitis piasezkii]
MRTSDGAISWNDFDRALVTSLPTQFKMPEIERRELEAFRQRSKELVTSFISRWREKISHVVDRLSENDHINMILRSLQPRFARHLMGFPHTNFGSLVQALNGIDEGIARGLEASYLIPSALSPIDYYSFCMRLTRQFSQVGLYPGYATSLGWTYIGLVKLGHPSITTNPLSSHSMYVAPPPSSGIHHIDFLDDDDSDGRDIHIVACSGKITTTTLERLIHMMTTDRPHGSDHTHSLYITVGCSSHELYPFYWTMIHRVRAIPFSFIEREVQTLEVEDFYRDFVAMLFDQHSNTVVLDMIRGMYFLTSMGLGRRREGPMEFVATIDYDTPFGLRFIPTKEAIDCGVVIVPTEVIDEVVPHDEYQDEMNMMSMSHIVEMVQPEPTSPFDLFGCLAIEYLLVSCDVTLSTPHSPTSHIFDIDDEVAQHDLNEEFYIPDLDLKNERVSPTLKDHEIVDFGTEDQPRELKIGSHLSSLRGMDSIIYSCHTWILQVKEEIRKQLSVGFILVVKYPERLANVVPVPKKDKKVRVCHSMLFFMDGFSEYNQILMALEDMKKTVVITEWGTYCYKVMSFGLKNTRATYRGRLWHYMIEYSVHLISHLDPLRYLFETALMFDIQYVSHKSIKGTIVVDHLVSLSIYEGRPIDDDFPDKEFVAMVAYRVQNQFVDALATLASSMDFPMMAEALTTRFVICGEILYRRSSMVCFYYSYPYSLVYGMEVIFPTEINMGSLRVALEQQISRQSGLKLD